MLPSTECQTCAAPDAGSSGFLPMPARRVSEGSFMRSSSIAESLLCELLSEEWCLPHGTRAFLDELEDLEGEDLHFGTDH